MEKEEHMIAWWSWRRVEVKCARNIRSISLRRSQHPLSIPLSFFFFLSSCTSCFKNPPSSSLPVHTLTHTHYTQATRGEIPCAAAAASVGVAQEGSNAGSSFAKVMTRPRGARDETYVRRYTFHQCQSRYLPSYGADEWGLNVRVNNSARNIFFYSCGQACLLKTSNKVDETSTSAEE